MTLTCQESTRSKLSGLSPVCTRPSSPPRSLPFLDIVTARWLVVICASPQLFIDHSQCVPEDLRINASRTRGAGLPGAAQFLVSARASGQGRGPHCSRPSYDGLTRCSNKDSFATIFLKRYA